MYGIGRERRREEKIYLYRVWQLFDDAQVYIFFTSFDDDPCEREPPLCRTMVLVAIGETLSSANKEKLPAHRAHRMHKVLPSSKVASWPLPLSSPAFPPTMTGKCSRSLSPPHQQSIPVAL